MLIVMIIVIINCQYTQSNRLAVYINSVFNLTISIPSLNFLRQSSFHWINHKWLILKHDIKDVQLWSKNCLMKCMTDKLCLIHAYYILTFEVHSAQVTF